MYYTVNGNKERDYVYNRRSEYVKEVSDKGMFNFKKAKFDRNSKVGKKCTTCFTIKSLAGKCECNS